MLSTYLIALGGGALIGLAATALWLGLGRVAGICSIWGELRGGDAGGRTWRLAFVAGIVGGRGPRLGSGCTSGHGVCGLSRLSVRPLAAVMTFMLTGGVTVAVVRLAGGWS